MLFAIFYISLVLDAWSLVLGRSGRVAWSLMLEAWRLLLGASSFQL
jgi:hypothetical protein